MEAERKIEKEEPVLPLERYLVDESWVTILKEEFDKPYFKHIDDELRRIGSSASPSRSQIFNAFNLTPFEKVKVVLLGQDPYPNPKHAHGLSFSTETGEIPPSLRNLFYLLRTQTRYTPPTSGNLNHWAERGVLLLNSILTVDYTRGAGSHYHLGWDIFTDKVLKSLKNRGIIFILIGKKSEGKKRLLDGETVVISSHPSPLNRKWKDSTLFEDLEALDVDFYRNPVQ